MVYFSRAGDFLLPSFTMYNPHPAFIAQICGDSYYPVYNPRPYFTATGDRNGAVRAWPNTNVKIFFVNFSLVFCCKYERYPYKY